MDDKPWFRPKAYGYGAGLPIAWQGWVVLGAYMFAAVAGSIWLAPRQPLAFLAILFVLTLGLVGITAAKTAGGWRWRWGEKD